MGGKVKEVIQEYFKYLETWESFWSGKYIDYELKIYETIMEDELWRKWKVELKKKEEKWRQAFLDRENIIRD